jgi:hypothetical protein
MTNAMNEAGEEEVDAQVTCCSNRCCCTENSGEQNGPMTPLAMGARAVRLDRTDPKAIATDQTANRDGAALRVDLSLDGRMDRLRVCCLLRLCPPGDKCRVGAITGCCVTWGRRPSTAVPTCALLSSAMTTFRVGRRCHKLNQRVPCGWIGGCDADPVRIPQTLFVPQLKDTVPFKKKNSRIRWVPHAGSQHQ